MNNEKYTQIYKSLGVLIKPLPSNYDPDDYGRRLFAMTQPKNGISYAASTDYDVEKYQNSNKKTKDL